MEGELRYKLVLYAIYPKYYMSLLVVKSHFMPLQYKTICIIKNILSFPSLKESLTYHRHTIASIMEQLKRKGTSGIKISEKILCKASMRRSYCLLSWIKIVDEDEIDAKRQQYCIKFY
jgi:hypothetical protein